MSPFVLAAMTGMLAVSGLLLLWRPPAPPWRRTAAGLARPVGSHLRKPTVSDLPAVSGWRGRSSALVAIPTSWLVLVGAPRVLGVPSLAPLPAAAAVTAGSALLLRVRTQRRRTDAERLAAGVAEVVGVLAADLRVGRSPAQALAALAGEATSDASRDALRTRLAQILRPLAETTRLGGSVPEAMRVAAAADGCWAFARVAAAWELAESCGAPVVPVLIRVASAVRAQADQVRDTRAELAGPRASARLLATLPIVGVLMGTGLGARPVHVLLETGYGQLALCAGVALELTGLAWTDRIAHAAEAR